MEIMQPEILASEELTMDALTLSDFLKRYVVDNPDMLVVCVMDDEERVFKRVMFAKTVGEDGAECFSIVLSETVDG